MAGLNEKLSMGETVSAIIKNAETGETRVIGTPPPTPTYKVEVTVTNLQTGEVHNYTTTR